MSIQPGEHRLELLLFVVGQLSSIAQHPCFGDKACQHSVILFCTAYNKADVHACRRLTLI